MTTRKTNIACFKGQKPGIQEMRAAVTVIPIAVLGQSWSLKVDGRIGIRKYRFLIDTHSSRLDIRPNVSNSIKTTNVSIYCLKTASGELMPIQGLVDLTF